VPLASDDAEIIPELSSPGMLMTDGCHGAAGITCGHRQSAHAHQVPCSSCGPGLGLPLSLHAAAACGQQPTSVSALVIFAGPHAWRHGSRPSPSAQAGQELNGARGCCASPAGIWTAPCTRSRLRGPWPRAARHLGRGDVARFYAAYFGQGDIQNLSTINLIVAQTLQSAR
jgi:hypothetical protein